MSVSPGLFAGADGTLRCRWCESTPAYQHYHDKEWGFPVTDDRRLFEKLCLEGFQAGLSWLTILNKREAFRRGFAEFDAERVARFGPKDVERLLGDAGIVRHRGKIESAINNAQRVLELREEFGSLAAYAWGFEPDPASRLRHHAESLAGHEHVARIGGDVEGPEEEGLELRRPDDGLRLHAGHGAGQRPRRGLPRARTGAGGAREASDAAP